MKIIVRSLAVLLVFLITYNLYPIKSNTVYTIAGASGVTVGIGSYCLGSYINIPYPAVWSILGGLGTTAVVYGILHAFTPEGRLNRANQKIECLTKNPIAMQSFGNDKAFFDALQEVYIADELWLIGAYNELVTLLEQARDALELIDKVRSESSDNYNLIQQCNMLSPRARTALINVTEAIKAIRSNKEYIAQLKLYQEMIAAEKQLQLQREITAVEKQKARAQESMAKAQHDMATIKGVKVMNDLSHEMHSLRQQA